ncbi:MAG: SHOCT domain-containing protein [Phycisphaerae bacterium]
MIWFALVVVGLGLLFVGFTVARRLLRPRTEPEAAFSLSAIREMHARGELSDAEFAKLKARVLKDSLSS